MLNLCQLHLLHCHFSEHRTGTERLLKNIVERIFFCFGTNFTGKKTERTGTPRVAISFIYWIHSPMPETNLRPGIAAWKMHLPSLFKYIKMTGIILTSKDEASNGQHWCSKCLWRTSNTKLLQGTSIHGLHCLAGCLAARFISLLDAAERFQSYHPDLRN